MVRMAVGGSFGALALFAVIAYLYRPAFGCGNTAARKQARRIVLDARDPVTHTPLSQRFSSGDLRCTDVSAPGGVLLAAHEQSGEAVVWFVDGTGKGHNVNLLAQAYTPSFAGAPAIPPAMIAEVSGK